MISENGKMYGMTLSIDHPNASKELIREAKKGCCESVRKTQKELGLKAHYLKIFVNPNYELRDPETGENKFVTLVAWKATMK